MLRKNYSYHGSREWIIVHYIYFYKYILFQKFYFWFFDLNLVLAEVFLCLVFLPLTLFRHNLKEEWERFVLIIFLTSFSLRQNWNSIASNGVLSSHAISIIRSTSSLLNLLMINNLLQNVIKTTRAHFGSWNLK